MQLLAGGGPPPGTPAPPPSPGGGGGFIPPEMLAALGPPPPDMGMMGGPPPMPEEPPPPMAFPGDPEAEAPDPYAFEEPVVVKAKPKRRPRPDEEWVKRQAENSVSYWGSRDTRMDEDWAMYRLDRTKYKTGAGQLILLNTPYVVVEKAADLLGKQKPSIDLIPTRNDQTEKAQAIEDFCRYCLSEWSKEWAASGYNSLWRDVAHFLSLRGWAALRINYDSDEEAVGQSFLPVRLRAYDPRQIYPSFGSKGLRHVVHRYSTTIDELVDDWGGRAKKLFSDNEDPLEIIEVTAYYDDWWHYVWCDKGILKPLTAHKYGRVPWLIGIGSGSPVRATSHNQHDWTAEVGVSMFHGAKDIWKQINRVLSQIATEVAKSANPPLIFVIDPASPEEPKKVRYEEGAVNYLYPNEQLKPIITSPNPTEVGPLLDTLNTWMTLATLPKELWGGAAAGSGFAMTLMAEAAEDKLWPYIKAMTHLMEQSLQFTLQLIHDLHDGPVGYNVQDPKTQKWRAGVTIDPDVIAEVGTDVRVSFRQVTRRDAAMMANLATTLTDKKLISMDTARNDYLNLDNPSGENEKVLMDLIYLDEDVVKALAKAAAKKNLPEAVTRIIEQAEAAAMQPPPNAMPPQPGPPGMPPPGPPGMPPQAMPPIMQTPDPMQMMLQSMGSAAGGMNAGPLAPPGIPGLPPMMPGV